jgi:hypothetical protein
MNGHWNSLIAFCDMASYVLAMVISGDGHFLKLSMVSEMSLISAAVIFTFANWDYIRGNEKFTDGELIAEKSS